VSAIFNSKGGSQVSYKKILFKSSYQIFFHNKKINPQKMFSRIERKEAFTVVGTQVTAPCECPSPQIPPIVCQYFKNRHGVKNIVSELEYGVNTGQEGGQFTYVFGQEVSKAEDIPECMVSKDVEASDYAVVTYKGSLKNLSDAFKFYFGTWLPQSEYTCVKRPQLEVYGKDFKGAESEESVMEIWFPIVKKAENTEKTELTQ